MSGSARKIVGWGLIGAAIVFVALAVAAVWLARPASLKARALDHLSRSLHLDVTLDSFSVTLLPRPSVSGTSLEFRIPNRPDLPPFIHVDRIAVVCSFVGLFTRHLDRVELDGMKIVVPAGGDKSDLPHLHTDGQGGSARVVVDRLDAHNAELTLLRHKASDTPLVFKIHALEVDGVSFGREMRFAASLTNPIPEGEIDTRGTFGPWPGSEVWALPITGTYTLTSAKLGTIKGIGGELTSTGRYSGHLTEISVTGTTETPDFSLDLGGQPVPLSTTFRAVVDASNGTTRLDEVDATLLHSSLVAEGLIANLPGPGNHKVDLKVTIDEGRIEDLLRLVLDSPKPVLTGDVTLKTTLSLPPGPARVRDRLSLVGQFGLDSAHFTDAQVQAKLAELSRRSQGKDEDEVMGRVLTSLSGSVELERGSVMFRRLSFHVPGAKVDLTGTYRLADQALDLEGTLTMQATVSQAVGGFKSIFLKPFDHIFKKNGAGAVVPITIGGTPSQPKFGVKMK